MAAYGYLRLLHRLSLFQCPKRDRAIGLANLIMDYADDEWATETLDQAHEYIATHGTREGRCWLVWSPAGWEEVK